MSQRVNTRGARGTHHGEEQRDRHQEHSAVRVRGRGRTALLRLLPPPLPRGLGRPRPHPHGVVVARVRGGERALVVRGLQATERRLQASKGRVRGASYEARESAQPFADGGARKRAAAMHVRYVEALLDFRGRSIRARQLDKSR